MSPFARAVCVYAPSALLSNSAYTRHLPTARTQSVAAAAFHKDNSPIINYEIKSPASRNKRASIISVEERAAAAAAVPLPRDKAWKFFIMP